jgi:mono/diheme cytochrome c family protein
MTGKSGSPTLSAARVGRLFGMRARRLLPLLLVLGSVALVSTGCFESEIASTTINGPITIGQGTTAKVVNPGEGASTETTGETTTEETTTEPGSTAESSTEETTTAESTAGSTAESTGTTTGGGSGADLAAGKTAFVATCGGCHSLKDAGTSGNVGPDLDSLAPLTAETVANQIKNGGGAMPPNLLQGADAANVAAYVASVAGK